MENQVQQLKLNVENIRSFLISSNKTISKLRIKKKNIENKQLKLKKREEREKKIEAKSSFLKSSAKNINKSIPSTPIKIFDKIMQFGFLILAGIVTESLPKIIEKIKEMVKGIQEIADVIKNKVQDIFNFMNKNFGDSDDPTGDYKQNREKIDKDLSLIKKLAKNLEKLMPADMQQMLMDIQESMGMQGTSIAGDGSQSDLTKLKKINGKIDSDINSSTSDSIANAKIRFGDDLKESGLNMSNLNNMSSYNELISTNFNSLLGMNMNDENILTNSKFNFSNSISALPFTPLEIASNIKEFESDSFSLDSEKKKDIIILNKLNTEIFAAPVGGGDGGGVEFSDVETLVSRAFMELD